MTQARTITILADPGALAAAAADHIVEVLRETLAARRVAHVALSGGSTPRAVNALLVNAGRDALDWDRVVFWFGDERCVPPDDADSNYGMNRATLLDPLRIAPDHVHRMRGEDDPTAAAADYAAILQRELGEQPRLDLILLGMGPDGHTASLFPGTVAGISRQDLVIAHYVPKLDRWRISLTPHAINAARHVMITAGGAEKADALYAVLDGAHEPDVYPSQIVHPAQGEVHWFLDAAAAAKHLAAADAAP
jgi:6-phosphogluconolactonase